MCVGQLVLDTHTYAHLLCTSADETAFILVAMLSVDARTARDLEDMFRSFVSDTVKCPTLHKLSHALPHRNAGKTKLKTQKFLQAFTHMPNMCHVHNAPMFPFWLTHLVIWHNTLVIGTQMVKPAHGGTKIEGHG